MDPDPRRVIADLRELDRLTGGPAGAQRVCWTDTWVKARDFLRGRLAEIESAEVSVDAAGNLWARVAGRKRETVALGSHLDSVPAGGWLDGALGVMGALEVLRVASAADPERSVALVDFADEEGTRFGRSLFGSSAVAGTLHPASLATLTDRDGRPLAEVLAEHGVELGRVGDAGRGLDDTVAYLELHIEQGPVLEREGIRAAAVTGTAGVERLLFTFDGQSSHAGTTPMDLRSDAGLSAAATALAVEQVATRHAGVGTTGAVTLEPGVVTTVPGRAEMSVDLRHPEAAPLAAMLEDVRAAARDVAATRGCEVDESPIWRIEPIAFDERLVSAVREATGGARAIASGALHDAAEMARRVPAAMVFSSSTAGISHAKEEDTPEPDLEAAISAYSELALRVIAGEVV
ncbi:MAG: Zn-dependent hydrolase [Thermoleophilaceae bacterium]|nr:Zn-dependent hydrolase [Thermoleophilaceae bacterium]